MHEADVIPIHELPVLPRRAPDGHKGTYGRVLVIAGCRGMSGAAVLCGRAALRGGAGLVQVATSAEVQSEVSAAYPGYTTSAIGEGLLEQARHATAIAIGPGLGQSDDVARLVYSILDTLSDTPIVVDADALNVLAPFTGVFKARNVPLVLTPHPGEFARLTGSAIPLNRRSAAIQFASRFGVVLVLKGMESIVTDGQKLYRNATGNPGMATGGSGDVLTGVIAALLAQGLTPWDAAVLGTWAHGRAGDLASQYWGQVGLNAVDLPDSLARALREVAR